MTAPVGPNQQPETWSAAAPGYARVTVQWTKFAEQALRVLPPEKTSRVIDIATGPGTLALPAAKLAAHVLATDFSPGMIEQLHLRAKEAGVTNIETKVADAQNLDIPSSTFDRAYCLFAYMFIPDRAKAFAEMLRVLVPGGRALIGTWSPLERRPIMQVAFESMAEAFPNVPRPAKGDLQSVDECVAEMSAAGFKDVRCVPYTGSSHVESPEQYVRWIVDGSAPLVMVKKQMGDQWPAAEAKLLEAVSKRIPKGGIDLDGEALFTVGTR